MWRWLGFPGQSVGAYVCAIPVSFSVSGFLLFVQFWQVLIYCNCDGLSFCTFVDAVDELDGNAGSVATCEVECLLDGSREADLVCFLSFAGIGLCSAADVDGT